MRFGTESLEDKNGQGEYLGNGQCLALELGVGAARAKDATDPHELTGKHQRVRDARCNREGVARPRLCRRRKPGGSLGGSRKHSERTVGPGAGEGRECLFIYCPSLPLVSFTTHS